MQYGHATAAARSLLRIATVDCHRRRGSALAALTGSPPWTASRHALPGLPPSWNLEAREGAFSDAVAGGSSEGALEGHLQAFCGDIGLHLGFLQKAPAKK